MKFRFLLWMLGFLMSKASRKNPAFQQQLVDKDLVFQLQTRDGQVARHFKVKDQRITSHGGLYPEPAFAIAFKDAAYGFATLPAKNMATNAGINKSFFILTLLEQKKYSMSRKLILG